MLGAFAEFERGMIRECKGKGSRLPRQAVHISGGENVDTITGSRTLQAGYRWQNKTTIAREFV
jgi:hypothetical protein